MFAEDVEVGDELPALTCKPSSEQLFRFSAVTWNAHRIHYDSDYAMSEGHPDILVQAHLHGALLTRMVTDWAGPAGRIRKVSWQNRGRATPSDTLTCKGIVRSKTGAGGALIELEVFELNQRAEVCAKGHALVELPSRDQRLKAP